MREDENPCKYTTAYSVVWCDESAQSTCFCSAGLNFGTASSEVLSQASISEGTLTSDHASSIWTFGPAKTNRTNAKTTTTTVLNRFMLYQPKIHKYSQSKYLKVSYLLVRFLRAPPSQGITGLMTLLIFSFNRNE